MRTVLVVLLTLVLVFVVFMTPVASAQTTVAEVKTATALAQAKTELAKAELALAQAEAALEAVKKTATTPVATTTPCSPIDNAPIPVPNKGWGYDRNFPVATQEVVVQRGCGDNFTSVAERRQTDKARKAELELAKIYTKVEIERAKATKKAAHDATVAANPCLGNYWTRPMGCDYINLGGGYATGGYSIGGGYGAPMFRRVRGVNTTFSTGQAPATEPSRQPPGQNIIWSTK